MRNQIKLLLLLHNKITQSIDKRFAKVYKRSFLMFLANVLNETGNFSAIEENLNYSMENLLKKVENKNGQLVYAFSAVRKVMNDPNKGLSWLNEGYAQAKSKGVIPEFIGNLIYNDHFRNNTWLGNKEPGDGYRFRGRGLLQITGRNIYTKLRDIAGRLGLYEDIVNHPDKLNDPTNSMIFSFIYWGYREGLYKAIVNNDIGLVRKLVNGGRVHGFKNTIRLFDKLKYLEKTNNDDELIEGVRMVLSKLGVHNLSIVKLKSTRNKSGSNLAIDYNKLEKLGGVA